MNDFSESKLTIDIPEMFAATYLGNGLVSTEKQLLIRGCRLCSLALRPDNVIPRLSSFLWPSNSCPLRHLHMCPSQWMSSSLQTASGQLGRSVCEFSLACRHASVLQESYLTSEPPTLPHLVGVVIRFVSVYYLQVPPLVLASTKVDRMDPWMFAPTDEVYGRSVAFGKSSPCKQAQLRNLLK